MTPYLQGVHLSLDSRRGERNKDGWKNSRRELLQTMCDNRRENDFLVELEAPEDVVPVPRLYNSLMAFEFLLEGSVSRRIQVRLLKTG